MGIFDFFEEIIAEIDKEIDKEINNENNSKKISSDKRKIRKMEYIDLTKKIETPQKSYERKQNQKRLKERLEKKFIEKEEKTFEQRYGYHVNEADKKYSYSDEMDSEISDTVQYEEDKLYRIEESENKKSKINFYSKKLRSRKNAREAFINSIIFNRKI